ncbi:uncharacterized protein ACNS7B_000398 isoform 2-T3 [Menidia menidia]
MVEVAVNFPEEQKASGATPSTIGLQTSTTGCQSGRSGKVEALSRAQAQSDPAIVRGLTRQKRSGLAVKDLGGQKGKGRWIRRSKKNLNVQPHHCIVTLPEGDGHVLLFQATGDVVRDEETRFDHGVKRRSFRGEEEEQQWLDV